MSQEILPSHYAELDRELKQDYVEYVGTNPEHIERYSRSLAFWNMKRSNISLDNSTGRDFAKTFMVSNAISELTTMIDNKFNGDIKKQIYDRVTELMSSKGKRIQQIKEDMDKWGHHSEQLHQEAIQDQCDGLLSPLRWIFNQDSMRKSWESWRNDMKTKPPIAQQLLGNNSFTKYMDFMYDTYPSGFGRALKYSHENEDYCDGAEIFYKLTNVDTTLVSPPESSQEPPIDPEELFKRFKKTQLDAKLKRQRKRINR